MEIIQEKLKTIFLNLDAVIIRLHGIIEEEQKYYYSKF